MFFESIWFGAVIFLLILANGFFAASEIAIIATRKTRIDTLLEKGVRSAAAVARLKNDPDRAELNDPFHWAPFILVGEGS